MKEKDYQALKKVGKLLEEVFVSVTNDIDDHDEIFNSKKAIAIISRYTSITTSLDELLYDLCEYFEELAFTHEEEE